MHKHTALFVGLAAIIVAGLYFSFSHSRLKRGGAATSPQAAVARSGPAVPKPTERSAPASTNFSAHAANQPGTGTSNPDGNP
jgi:hypothetical protein